ncbi:MAG: hypothetical protein IJW96_01655 [Clostridia bacterium]|nr:hypothetical protein [Clostridia bacterium]
MTEKPYEILRISLGYRPQVGYVLEQRKGSVVLGHRKRASYAFAHLVPKKHY